ncbi:hypothetical protein FOPG_09872 [Fusarium oxysporum f. sp. conglutinans race 2 54008]|uniref:Uncharacterized protein n=1 Tax=Fusarium oxysporum f. sp. conglutinans race 2 54008 TaxID=1089457 RepID=X0HTR9_FUSOX|nr:hypothetical protein FOPG_09872 [Fusarium oxysporum f. sp. conglutinans race 2 54008]
MPTAGIPRRVQMMGQGFRTASQNHADPSRSEGARGARGGPIKDGQEDETPHARELTRLIPIAFFEPIAPGGRVMWVWMVEGYAVQIHK